MFQSFLVLLTICHGDLLQAGQRRGARGFRSEEDIINTRRKLAAIMDPRRRHKASIDEVETDKSNIEAVTTSEVPSRKSRVFSPHSLSSNFNNQPIIKTSPRKILLKSSKTPSEFVPKLNSVMGISYMNSGSFRNVQQQNPSTAQTTSTTTTTQKPTSSVLLSGGSSYSYQTTFDEYVPRVYDDMNLSYMNSDNFRDSNNFIRSFGDDYKRVKPRTRKFVRRKRKKSHGQRNEIRSETNRSQKINFIKSQPYNTNIMQWTWPTNMDFNHFNFKSFDAQFSNQKKQEQHPSIVLPGIYSLKADATGNSYSLSILL